MVCLGNARRFALMLCTVVALLARAQAQSGSPFVSGAWSGNVTSTSGTVCIRLGAPGLRVRAVVGTTDQLNPAIFSSVAVSNPAAGNAVSLDVAGLQPNTTYYYGIEVDGVRRTESISRGRFRTFPQGAASFKIALVGDCDYRDEDQRVFEAVAAEDPLFLLFNGDIHYADIASTSVEDYRVAYDNVLRHAAEGALLRSTAIAYMWDDHDFAGGDNSNGTAAGGVAARSVYREYVPHYPLQVPDGSVGQAFTVGRVRIIMTDLRSASVPAINPESAGKTKLGFAQKAWFKQELLNARDAGFPLILWLSTEPWIGPAQLGDDSWAGYATERTEIANFLKDNRIRNLVIYSGDMHAIAYDDGSHSDYATGGGAPLTVLHAAPLTRDPNIKGGPFTAGPFLGSQQYGILEIIDTGGTSVQCRFSGKRLAEGAKVIYQFSASGAAVEPRVVSGADAGGDRALVNLAARGRISAPTDSLIAGFVVGGRSSRNILVRAVGPSLGSFGVADALALPMLSLFKGPTLVASNENWGLLDAPRLTAIFDRVGAFRFVNAGSRDAALYLSLEPGSYTAQATGISGSLGAILLEVYEVP